MSIAHIIDKIKSKIAIDKFVFIYSFIIVVVAISAFVLGRISVNPKAVPIEALAIKGNQSRQVEYPASEDVGHAISQAGKQYLASKNGKLYYKVGCSGAKRISPKNIVYFNSASEAEYDGYKPDPKCK